MILFKQTDPSKKAIITYWDTAFRGFESREEKRTKTFVVMTGQDVNVVIVEGL